MRFLCFSHYVLVKVLIIYLMHKPIEAFAVSAVFVSWKCFPSKIFFLHLSCSFLQSPSKIVSISHIKMTAPGWCNSFYRVLKRLWSGVNFSVLKAFSLEPMYWIKLIITGIIFIQWLQIVFILIQQIYVLYFNFSLFLSVLYEWSLISSCVW